MGKIENQSFEIFEIIGKNFGRSITVPSSWDVQQVNGELPNLHNRHELSLLNVTAYLGDLRVLKETIEPRLSRNGDQ